VSQRLALALLAMCMCVLCFPCLLACKRALLARASSLLCVHLRCTWSTAKTVVVVGGGPVGVELAAEVAGT